MPTSRYYFQPKIGNKLYATSDLYTRIYRAAESGVLMTNVQQVSSSKRLDVLAYEAYGDATLWWIIAAASGIGWSMQLSPGTYVRVPSDLNMIYEMMRS